LWESRQKLVRQRGDMTKDAEYGVVQVVGEVLKEDEKKEGK
jgi:hypothetical protein